MALTRNGFELILPIELRLTMAQGTVRGVFGELCPYDEFIFRARMRLNGRVDLASEHYVLREVLSAHPELVIDQTLCGLVPELTRAITGAVKDEFVDATQKGVLR